MTEQCSSVIHALEEQGVAYQLTAHPAVFTMEDLVQAGVTAEGPVCKNLFLRDAKGKKHYLVVCSMETQVDLKKIAEKLRSTKLSFASAERLQKYLGLTPGSVSPLAVLNDTEHAVTVAFDKSLAGLDKLGVHPNDNTATVWLAYEDLERFVKDAGNPVMTISL